MNSKQKQAGLWLLPAFFTFLIIIGLILWFINPVMGYRLQVASDGAVIYDVPVSARQVEIAFRHSVNKGYIREIYRLDLDRCQLALENGYFENYGAGMLDTVPEDVGLRQEGNYLILDFPLIYQDKFTYRAGREAQHRLYYGEDILSLYEIIPQKSFEISIVKNTLRNAIK